jgi:molybdate transport system substrate-binding protein
MAWKFHLAARIATAMTFGVVVFGAGSVAAAEIKILASANAGLRSALVELAPQFERATGHRITMDFASAIPLKRRVDGGEAFDVFFGPALIDDLIKQGKVAAATRTVIARTGLGLGVLKGVPKPDISTVESFKHTLLNAKSIGNNAESEPGIQFLAILDRLAIAQDVRPRLKETGGDMGTALEKREVDIAISSITNLLAASTIDVIGFPSEIQTYLHMVAGVSATSKEPEAAKSYLRFLLSPTVASVFKAKGFDRE